MRGKFEMICTPCHAVKVKVHPTTWGVEV